MIRLIGTNEKGDEVLLYYAYTKSTKNFFKYITSSDGFEFNGSTKYVIVTDAKGREEPKYDWQNLLISRQKDQYIGIYKVNASTNKNINIAVSEDMIRWKKLGKIENIKEVGAVIPDYLYKHRHVLYFGEKNINLAYSSQLAEWKILDRPLLENRSDSFDNGEIEVGNVFNQDDHILLVYYAKHKIGNKTHYSVGAAGFDKKNPEQLLWRLNEPLWEEPKHLASDSFRPLGVAMVHNQIILYWVVNNSHVYAISCPLPVTGNIKDKDVQILLNKTHKNPIISPIPKKKWESRATFNSAAVYEDGKVHFVYRALGDSDLSVLGYATSKDGITIDERSDEPIYIPREPFETPGGNMFKTFADHFASGGGYGGIEDPKLTKIDNRFYMTYVAFDGATPPRVALTSISVEDFLDKKWDNWEKPRLISAPGMVNKSATIFPEKINGKYAIFHRVYPNILVDYVEDLNFDDNKYLTGQYFIPPRKKHWDSKKLSAGAPPIRTKDGWLLIYHAVGYQDSAKYKVGAMMLDHKDPTKVLYRTNNPIISPDEHYENAGHKSGVVYPCGAVVKNNDLYVYYGGADTVVCAASQNLDTFLSQMKNHKEPRLRRVSSPVLN